MLSVYHNRGGNVRHRVYSDLTVPRNHNCLSPTELERHWHETKAASLPSSLLHKDGGTDAIRGQRANAYPNVGIKALCPPLRVTHFCILVASFLVARSDRA